MLPKGWPLVIVIILILLLFAAPKLPQLARNLGQSMRIFRSEVKQMKDEDQDSEKSQTSQKDSAESEQGSDIRAVEGTVVEDEPDQQHSEHTAQNNNRS
ncbi:MULTISPECIES: Sec-independent protein translocase subunit TatA [Auritidibacter]|uniref:Sec-independent protein translocase subunit TatA n=1 Tax=Auritidibacter TaxID=1160973 RepID=UPI000D737C1B|nr:MULTISPECIES: Sec-independent protein translocase subunit TatA [Auritidibacter]PXA81522.1 Sec-independent protein translocase TatA [Auritidibacter sp. NML120636]WGH82138.1 Sec-independent protein translocase subunit TatA [Auritidibacter ignavus]WGH84398.1 Sec-independent protein translocase subunit TatA [Auritidibacter ignavus]WGH91332.1 Sec-independent protein translocase subunit TatA [Auritidibacter ignavus]